MNQKVCIVGLGYVGFPLCILCAKKGYNVTGIDINPEIVDKLNKGISHIKDKFLENELKELKGRVKATTDGSNELKEADIIIICVPTPVDDNNQPLLDQLKSAFKKIGENIKPGQLVILESTVYHGAIEEIVKPVLEETGLKAGKDFYLAHCPERIDPGNKKWNISNIPRVLGAMSEKGGRKAKEFYSSIINAEITLLKTLKEAEATKMLENSFRDLNIAFINEMAKSFDKAGIDIMEVIKGASTKPFGFLPHYPSCGVGGHCIPVDPHYLIEKAKEYNFNHELISKGREVNESMPSYTVGLLSEEVTKINKEIKDVSIGIYGTAFKKDIDDIRNSPSLAIIELLKKRGANLIIYDPLIETYNNVSNIDEFLQKSDCIIIATDHTQCKEIKPSEFMENNIKIIIDGKNCLNKEEIKKLGIIYRGIGISN